MSDFTPAALGRPEPGFYDAAAAAWLGAWAGRELGAFEAVCAPEVTYEGPVTDGVLRGPRTLAAHAHALWLAFPDLSLEAGGDVLERGLLCAVPWVAGGTQRGEFAGVPATRRRLQLRGIDCLELAGGRVLRARSFFDLHDAAVQLGVLPARGTVSERALLTLRGFGLRLRGG